MGSWDERGPLAQNGQLGHQRAPLPGRQAAPQLLDPQSVMLTCPWGESDASTIPAEGPLTPESPLATS